MSHCNETDPGRRTSDEPTQPAEDDDYGLRALATPVSRRRLVGGTVVAGIALVAAACGGDDDEPTTGTTAAGRTAPMADDHSGDLLVAELAASLEVLAVRTYEATLAAARANKLGTVPPAVSTYLTTALGHHEEHRDYWNSMLARAGKPKVSAPNVKLGPTVDAELTRVKNVIGAATLALTLEESAAHTYLKAIPSLKGVETIRKAAEIQVVDQQHQSILLYTLGRYPVPEAFQKTDKAVT